MYTLASIALIEDSLQIDIHALQETKFSPHVLAVVLYAGLLDQHPEVTFQEVKGIVKKDPKAVFHFAQAALSKSVPKIEEKEEATKEDKDEAPVTHWEYWERLVSLLRIHPREAERMTPREIAEAAKAYRESRKEDLKLVAFHLVHIINMFSSKKVTISDLIEPSQDEDDDGNAMDFEAGFDELWLRREAHRLAKEEASENA